MRIDNEPISQGTAIGTSIVTLYQCVAPAISATVDIDVVSRALGTNASLQVGVVDASFSSGAIPDASHVVPKDITIGTTGNITSGFFSRTRLIVPAGKKVVAISNASVLTGYVSGYSRINVA